MTWRCRFDSSTTSKSTMPSVPTPAAARYSSAGLPRPPAPMTRTLAFFSRFCPVTPTSGMIRCRLYRATSSLVSSAAGSTSGGSADIGSSISRGSRPSHYAQRARANMPSRVHYVGRATASLRGSGWRSPRLGAEPRISLLRRRVRPGVRDADAAVLGHLALVAAGDVVEHRHVVVGDAERLLHHHR